MNYANLPTLLSNLLPKNTLLFEYWNTSPYSFSHTFYPPFSVINASNKHRLHWPAHDQVTATAKKHPNVFFILITLLICYDIRNQSWIAKISFKYGCGQRDHDWRINVRRFSKNFVVRGSFFYIYLPRFKYASHASFKKF